MLYLDLAAVWKHQINGPTHMKGFRFRLQSIISTVCGHSIEWMIRKDKASRRFTAKRAQYHHGAPFNPFLYYFFCTSLPLTHVCAFTCGSVLKEKFIYSFVQPFRRIVVAKDFESWAAKDFTKSERGSSHIYDWSRSKLKLERANSCTQILHELGHRI
jgi:hypothetical protein